MNNTTEGERLRGTVELFSKTQRNGIVSVDGKRIPFHSSAYNSRSSVPPQTGDSVEVVMIGNSLLEVRARR